MQIPESQRKLVEDTIKVWRLDELAVFAIARHRYGNDGYGVTYPEDLDPGDDPMPPDTVEIYGDYGEAYSVVIPEAGYLDVLADVLRRNGLGAAAEAVAALSNRLRRDRDQR